jgi:mycothiol synthase
VALSVDAESPTGATRLYERVGMRAYQEFVLYEKELRAGKPLSGGLKLSLHLFL